MLTLCRSLVQHETLKIYDKETLKEISHIDPFQVRKLFKKDSSNYIMLRDSSKCISVGGAINDQSSDVPVITKRSKLKDEYVKYIVEKTRWVIVTEEDDNQIQKVQEFIEKVGHMSTGTDILAIVNGVDDC